MLDLPLVGRGDVGIAGGKGANLGELIRAGFTVPPGFVVTTEAYDRFVAHNHLDQAVARIHELGESASSLRLAFETATMPPGIEQGISITYERLGAGAVAVRSSGTAEDLPGAAFAGQHETFLNVQGTAAVLNAVRRCWASLWGERAIAYRAHLGMASEPVKIAVVVQRLVNADVAGVLFTANPLTGRRDEMLVEASPGLGESIVSGLVTPDHYVLRKAWWGWRVVERRRGRGEAVVRASGSGGTVQVARPPRVGHESVLPNRELRRLARLGRAIERHFGGPLDVEWAWPAGRVFILQARPITALPPVPPLRLPRPLASMAAEFLAVRPYPLDLSTWLPAIHQAIAPVFEALGLVWRPLERIFAVDDGVVVGLSGTLPFRPTLGVFLAPSRFVRLARAHDPRRWEEDPLLAAALARAHELDGRHVAALSWEQLLDTLRAALALPRSLAGKTRQRYFPRAALAVGLLRLMLGLSGHGTRLAVLLSGAETRTLAANRALEALAARVCSEPLLADTFARQDAAVLAAELETFDAGRAWLEDFQAFLDRCGHREGTVLSASLPTWRDAPEIPLGIVKGLALAPARTSEVPAAWERARDEVLISPWFRIPGTRAAFLELLATARCLLQIREDTHFYATLPLPLVRRLILEMGRRLVEVGALDRPGDIFHLTLAELEGLRQGWPPPSSTVAQLHASANRRIERRAAAERAPLVDLTPPSAPAAGEGNVLLRGSAGSPGLTQGPVRVILGGTDFGALRPGEVLVAPYTNPGWTPLFQRAAAVVVDTGGVASHAAIVAREYRIPAVMGTGDGTQRLATGQWVRVDGTRGLVTASEPPAG